MGSVQSINPELELVRFFDYLYGSEEGYVYSPTKDPNTEEFEQHFFHWPTERDALIQHVLTLSDLYEVYYGPGLYRERKATKEAFKGTNFLWAEFDGTVPESVNVPPTLRIVSSVSGHEHWYWKLESFCSDQSLLENISQRLTYHLQADLSCWNANRVLRPPGTTHHESGNIVSIIDKQDRVTSLEDFVSLPDLPVKLLQDTDINYIPPAVEVIFKYKFEAEVSQLFTLKKLETKEGKPEGHGHRSSALTKLAFYFVEMGMTNAEILSLLLHADDRWGKFKRRSDRHNKLLGIINYCRSTKAGAEPPVDQTKDVLRIYNFEEFINTEVKLEWAIENLVHKEGYMLLSGPPDIGKSQLTIRFMENLCKGKNYLKWNISKPMKCLFISMEMGFKELHFVMNDIMHIKTDDYLKENMLLLPIGSSLKLGSKVAQHKIIEMLEEHRPDGVFIDSLSTAVNDEINSDKVILEMFNFVNAVIRQKYGAFVWFVHHPRKGQIGNKKPKTRDDIYGSTFITTLATSILGLWPERGVIEMTDIKGRLFEKGKSIDIRRTPGVDFEIVAQKELGNISGPIFGNSTLEDSI